MAKTQYEIGVVRCPDRRCDVPIAKALKRMGVDEDECIFTTAFGASLSITTLEAWIQDAVKISGIQTLLVFDHGDCKKYKKELSHQSRHTHEMKLKDAGDWLKKMFPKLEFRLFYMHGDAERGVLAEYDEIFV